MEPHLKVRPSARWRGRREGNLSRYPCWTCDLEHTSKPRRGHAGEGSAGERREQAGDLRAELPKLDAVGLREPVQDRVALGRERHPHPPPVTVDAVAAHIALVL